MEASKIAAIIPALNEEGSIARVIEAIPRSRVGQILVVDNGSSDKTAEKARSAGAWVISEPRRGYGRACLAGIAALSSEIQMVVFLDGDFSDFPEDIPSLLEAMERQQADLVIGSRTTGAAERGSLTAAQRFGNWLSINLIRCLFGHRYTDLGPFRAIRLEALRSLAMQDLTYGWTVEMQVKALQKGLRVVEVPVRYRKRIGHSKISGSISGSLKAGWKILWTITRLAFKRKFSREKLYP